MTSGAFCLWHPAINAANTQKNIQTTQLLPVLFMAIAEKKRTWGPRPGGRDFAKIMGTNQTVSSIWSNDLKKSKVFISNGYAGAA